MKTLAAVLLAIALGFATTVKADTNIEMDEAIDISATYNQPAGSDRLKVLRAKLEKQNEQLVRKQIETLRLKNELELTKRTQQAFNQMMNNLEEVQ